MSELEICQVREESAKAQISGRIHCLRASATDWLSQRVAGESLKVPCDAFEKDFSLLALSRRPQPALLAAPRARLEGSLHASLSAACAQVPAA